MTKVMDWIGYQTVSGLGTFFRKLPLKTALSLGRLLGRGFFYLSNRRRVAYADIKAAFGPLYDEGSDGK